MRSAVAEQAPPRRKQAGRTAEILAFATQGAGGDDESRLRVLLGRLQAEFIPFDKTKKAGSLKTILNACSNRKPKLIVAEGTGVAGGAALLLCKWLFGVRYVLSSGDAVAPFLSARIPLAKPLFALYERLLCANASGFIGWTPYLVGRALTLGAPRGITAAGWAPFQITSEEQRRHRQRIRTRLGIPPDAIVFGIAGSLAWSDRYQYCYGRELVEARLRAQAPHVYVMIVGGGAGQAHLRARAGDHPAIVFTGRVSREEVPEYLSAMDIGSLPQSVDGVGNFRYTTKISEYIAAGLPFITNETPAAYDLHNGSFWRLPGNAPWDPRFAKALTLLMERTNRGEISLKRTAQLSSHTRLFNKEDQVASVTAFVQDLIGGA